MCPGDLEQKPRPNLRGRQRSTQVSRSAVRDWSGGRAQLRPERSIRLEFGFYRTRRRFELLPACPDREDGMPPRLLRLAATLVVAVVSDLYQSGLVGKTCPRFPKTPRVREGTRGPLWL